MCLAESGDFGLMEPNESYIIEAGNTTTITFDYPHVTVSLTGASNLTKSVHARATCTRYCGNPLPEAALVLPAGYNVTSFLVVSLGINSSVLAPNEVKLTYNYTGEIGDHNGLIVFNYFPDKNAYILLDNVFDNSASKTLTVTFTKGPTGLFAIAADNIVNASNASGPIWALIVTILVLAIVGIIVFVKFKVRRSENQSNQSSYPGISDNKM
jgi:hypothetical protein